MIATVFLMSAVGNKIPKFNDVAAYMASEGIPMPQVALAGAIVFLIAGSLSVIAGFKIRLGAALLLENLTNNHNSNRRSSSVKAANHSRPK